MAVTQDTNLAGGPLHGLRVVEMASAIQGPAAGLFFANMGADVVKVEPPLGGGSRRHRGANNSLPREALGSQFIATNKGKRSVSVDIHTELGQAVVHRLLSKADVFISNFRATALERMGLALGTLNDTYPQLVIGHVSGFGPRGADADKAMLDGAAQARGGLASLSGHPNQVPTPPGAAVADHAGAMQLALACVTALVTRDRTGVGQLVQVSSLGAQLWLQLWELQQSAITDQPLSRDGPHLPNVRAPYGVYLSSDGVPVQFVTAMSEESWTAFWLFVDMPEALLMTEWDTRGKRIGAVGSEDNLVEIRELMRLAIGSKTMAELAAFFQAQPEIIWEQVRSHDEVLTDPQNVANDYIMDIDLPIIGKTKTVGSLMSFSRTPTGEPSVPPDLGADTEIIMAELGFGASEIGTLVGETKAQRER